MGLPLSFREATEIIFEDIDCIAVRMYRELVPSNDKLKAVIGIQGTGRRGLK